MDEGGIFPADIKMFFRNLHKEQAHWKTWSQNIENLPKEYDCAIGYVEGCMNYFVIDKVKAKRKILWIHNVYTALKYNPDFDFDFFSKADNVVTMSESGVESLQHTFPQLKQKFIVLENISNGKLIEKFSLSSIEENEYKNFKGLKLLSIGRLMDQKIILLLFKRRVNCEKRNCFPLVCYWGRF